MRTDKAKPIRTQSDTLILVACICFIPLACIHCGVGEDRAYSRESTITVLYRRDERVLGPYWGVTPQFLVFLPLVARNAKGELEGRLAERWEHSADYRSWTIHLRKNVHWQDGVRVTAHDIKFTLDLLRNAMIHLKTRVRHKLQKVHPVDVGDCIHVTAHQFDQRRVTFTGR